MIGRGRTLSPRLLLLGLAALIACLALAPGASAALPSEQPFEIPHFDAWVLQQDGEPATQAGSHPFTNDVEVDFPIVKEADEEETPLLTIKDQFVDLPPGFVGDPYVVGTCQPAALERGASNCPGDSQVGIARVLAGAFIPGTTEPNSFSSVIFAPVYSLERTPGHVATFGFTISNTLVPINVSVRSGSDYGLRFEVLNTPLSLPLGNVRLTLWGVPADPSHDALRGNCMNGGIPVPRAGCPAPSDLERLPFISLPTSCSGPQTTRIRVTTWEGAEDEATSVSHDNTAPEPNPVGIEGCNKVEFSPSLEARPTTNVADSPSGLNLDLAVPQNFEPDGAATAHLRKAVITLPEGLVLNPSGGNGLGSCSEAEIGVTSPRGAVPVHFQPEPGSCKDSSKLGTVEIDSSSLERPLFGNLFIATPRQNPFGDLVTTYLEAYDPVSNFMVKLAGAVHLDPGTGRVSFVFDENPQLPFDHLKVKIAGGAAAPFRTPEVCGTFSTTSQLTPWSAPESGPPATPSDSYAIQRGAVGGSCPTSSSERAHTPSFDAGTVAPLAGADSPLIVNLRREDGTQQFRSITISPPPGLIGNLAGIPYCSDAALAIAAAKTGLEERANPSCPAGSEIGNVYTAAGAGPAPYNAPGKAYLTGPYKGAPIGLAIVTPAVAGPFDLGTIVVRAALNIDPTNVRITAVADPIPTVLDGIPLDIRSVSIQLDRAAFVRNPTSCDPMSFDGQLVSALDVSASLFSRFQLGECGRLGFKPQIALGLSGNPKRRGHPGLTARLTMKAGEANLKSVSVAMPKQVLLDQSNLDNICTRVQFAASSCPPSSVYGEATVTTPILDHQLSGPVYLRSSSNKLPDLVPDLRGPADQPIRIETAGRTDTVKGGLRNSFESIPDAPFSILELKLKGGREGLLQSSTNLCKKKYRATVKFGAQNGLRSELHPVLKAACGKGKKRHNRSHRRRASRRSAR